jgi:TRAP-type C4-dicarboxylate transport system permease small subunit
VSVETLPPPAEGQDVPPPEGQSAPPPPAGVILKGLRLIDGGIAKAEKALLVVLIAFILLAVISQIVGRQFGLTHPGFMEASVFAMLAVALFSGSIATHHRRHISIDVVSRMLPASLFTVLSTAINLLGCVVMLYLTRAALFYVEINRISGDYASPALKLQYWWIQTLLPLAFAIMAFRFFLLFLEDANRVRTRAWLSPVHVYDTEHRM